MKKLIFAVLMVSALLAVSCKKNNPTTADIRVTCVPMAGEAVDVNGLLVQLHHAATFDQLFKEATCAGAPTMSNATFNQLTPGTYYVCAWKDNDNSTTFTEGDFFGFYTAPVKADAGDNLKLNVEVYVLQ